MTVQGQLISALKLHLPNATFHIAECRDWCSITFSGQKLAIFIEATGESAIAQTGCFAANVHELEFALSGAIVADITVANIQYGEDRMKLKINVLVLDD